jgi:hypothetical protein
MIELEPFASASTTTRIGDKKEFIITQSAFLYSLIYHVLDKVSLVQFFNKKNELAYNYDV